MTRRLAILASFSGDGGVERALATLLNGFVDAGIAVDLLLIRSQGPFVKAVPGAVKLIKLGSDHTFLDIREIARYLRTARPPALLAVKHRAVLAAIWARRLSGVPVRIVGAIHTSVSASFAGRPARGAMRKASMRLFYPDADAVVAVSAGAAADIRTICPTMGERVVVIHNPVVSPRLFDMARAPAPHPWLDGGAGSRPVIMGIGRLTEAKDFPTLIRAFALTRAATPCRLVILGRGRLLAELEGLARHLGFGDDVVFPGFVDNPYAWLSRARLFALSSRVEGFGMVLAEALALGVPVVATDCPSGPREVLQGGRYGALVPVGDAPALAAAMIAALAAPPPDRSTLAAATADYTVEVCTRRYLAVLGLA